jgi:hypothetical protein
MKEPTMHSTAQKTRIEILLAALFHVLFCAVSFGQDPNTAIRSHPPMRPLPAPAKSPLPDGPKYYVEPTHGDDRNAGAEQAPWKTLAHALRHLKPGDTLVLRGGTYYEKPSFSKSGEEGKPITLCAHPGELAIIDGGLREFCESPASSWEPLAGGAEGEFVSTKAYPEADARRAPQQFLPACWEPMWGIEDERPIAIGHFADSMVPLHGYRTAVDLRSTNEFWLKGKKGAAKVEPPGVGMYAGPGLWFNRETGRVHVRLAHTKLAGLGDRAYRGETDPRKLPLVVALGFGESVARITGVKNLRLRDIAFRGATGSPLVHVYGSENIELDHVTVFGGFPGLLIDACKNIRITHSAFRELAAPWTSRAHMKYRGTATYCIILQNDQPLNENIEFANCEFTDGHDFAFFRFAKSLQFHHNFVDNFNDDGLECGPKLREQNIFIWQNRIGAITSPLTQHENYKDESPLDYDPKSGEFIYRNVFDLRAGIYRTPPMQADPTGEYLSAEGHLIGDHGSPIYPVIHFYHNTVLRQTPVFRGYFLFAMGPEAMNHTERDVFNNIFVQMNGLPGANITRRKEAEALHEGGNLLWGVKEGPAFKGDLFAKFRASPLFQESRKQYEPGWTTNDRLADPKFIKPPVERVVATDLRLQPDSPAVKAGLPVPAEWPDPLRGAGNGPPDIGAIPLGAAAWGVGVEGRIPLFGATP